MNIITRINYLFSTQKSPAQELYITLSDKKYTIGEYRKDSLQEGMWEINQSIYGWWKPRYLINDNTKCAYEIMNESETFVRFTRDDIDMKSLKSLPEFAIERAKCLSAQFPTKIGCFTHGVAQVSWQINPDGQYYMDSDGYGMTNDDEIEIYGFIDTEMNVLVKFQHINKNWARLKQMRFEAEKIVKK